MVGASKHGQLDTGRPVCSDFGVGPQVELASAGLLHRTLCKEFASGTCSLAKAQKAPYGEFEAKPETPAMTRFIVHSLTYPRAPSTF